MDDKTEAARQRALIAVPELVILDECGEVNTEYPYEACTGQYDHDGDHWRISSGQGSPKGVVTWRRT